MDVVEGGCCVAPNKKAWADDVLVVGCISVKAKVRCWCTPAAAVWSQCQGQRVNLADPRPIYFFSAVVALNPDVELDFIATAENSPWLIFLTDQQRKRMHFPSDIPTRGRNQGSCCNCCVVGTQRVHRWRSPAEWWSSLIRRPFTSSPDTYMI